MFSDVSGVTSSPFLWRAGGLVTPKLVTQASFTQQFLCRKEKQNIIYVVYLYTHIYKNQFSNQQIIYIYV